MKNYWGSSELPHLLFFYHRENVDLVLVKKGLTGQDRTSRTSRHLLLRAEGDSRFGGNVAPNDNVVKHSLFPGRRRYASTTTHIQNISPSIRNSSYGGTRCAYKVLCRTINKNLQIVLKLADKDVIPLARGYAIIRIHKRRTPRLLFGERIRVC